MKKIKYITIVLIAIFTFSCSDFLENDVAEIKTINSQFATYSGNVEVLNGCYEKLEDIFRANIFMYGDLLGGNISFAPIVTGSNKGLIEKPELFDLTYDFTNLANESEYNSFYENAYKVLSSLNYIMSRIDNVVATNEQKNQVKAESLAMRAFIHHNLLRLFAQNYDFTANASHLGIVYANQIYVGGVDFPARKTVAQCYDLLVSDYKLASTLFQNQSAIPGPLYSYFNKSNTQALLSRVYLDKNDFSNAIQTAQNVINNSGVLLTNSTSYIIQWEYLTLPISETLMELSVPTDSENVVGASLSKYFGYVSVDNYQRFVASPDLMNLFDTNDIRKNNFLVKTINTRLVTGNVLLNYNFTKKFQNSPGTLVIRLSEMYLILAEAQVKSGQTSQSLTNLNVIRNRSGLISLVSPTNLLDEILLEKRKEFCFEGHLFFDLARNKKNITRTLGCISSQCNLNYPNYKYVLPIPENSINTNSNMIQNENY